MSPSLYVRNLLIYKCADKMILNQQGGKLATKMFNSEEVELQDGTEVELRPLVIGKLRRFMEAWQEFANVEDDADGFDVFINCCGIALEDNFKGTFETLRASSTEEEKGEWLSPKYKEYLEDVLELPTIYRILEVCGSIKMADPKEIEKALTNPQ